MASFNQISAASFRPHIARRSNLCWQGVDVRQDEASQFMSLDSLIFGNAIFLVDRVVTQKAQAVCPFLQVRSEFAGVGKRVNARRQSSGCMFRGQVFGGQFKCPSVHSPGRVPFIASNRAGGLLERTRHVFRAVLRNVRCLWFRNYSLNVYGCLGGGRQEIAMQLAGVLRHFRKNQRDDRVVAIVAHEVDVIQRIVPRYACLARVTEPLGKSAVGAMVRKGKCHE